MNNVCIIHFFELQNLSSHISYRLGLRIKIMNVRKIIYINLIECYTNVNRILYLKKNIWKTIQIRTLITYNICVYAVYIYDILYYYNID